MLPGRDTRDTPARGNGGSSVHGDAQGALSEDSAMAARTAQPEQRHGAPARSSDHPERAADRASRELPNGWEAVHDSRPQGRSLRLKAYKRPFQAHVERSKIRTQTHVYLIPIYDLDCYETATQHTPLVETGVEAEGQGRPRGWPRCVNVIQCPFFWQEGASRNQGLLRYTDPPRAQGKASTGEVTCLKRYVRKVTTSRKPI